LGWFLHHPPTVGALERIAEDPVNQLGHRDTTASAFVVEHTDEFTADRRRVIELFLGHFYSFLGAR